MLKSIYRLEDSVFNESIGELCEILEIKDYLDTQVRKLSLGERMKMELIGSILHKPKVLFLDEPTIGLDITARKNVSPAILAIRDKSKTFSNCRS